MKKIYIVLLMMMPLFIFSSCLKSNMDELDEYSGTDITSVRGLYYYYSYKTSVNGDDIFNWGDISRSDVTIDKDAGTVVIGTATVKGVNQNQFNQTKVVMFLNISTAATITPESGSATPGIEADWTAGKANTYVIKAADGSTKKWTVTVKKYVMSGE